MGSHALLNGYEAFTIDEAIIPQGIMKTENRITNTRYGQANSLSLGSENPGNWKANTPSGTVFYNKSAT
jgi:hypothetical protein